MTDLPRFVPPRTSSTENSRRRYLDLDGERPAQVVGAYLTLHGVATTSPGVVFLDLVFGNVPTAGPGEDVLALLKRTAELQALPAPGRPAPSAVARLVAAFVLPRTIDHVVPDRVTATSDGGVMFYFLGRHHLAGRRYASLEVHEGGELVMLQSDREAGSMPSVEDVSASRSAIAEALESIRSFIDPTCQEP